MKCPICGAPATLITPEGKPEPVNNRPVYVVSEYEGSTEYFSGIEIWTCTKHPATPGKRQLGKHDFFIPK